jgi:hypothetical protein
MGNKLETCEVTPKAMWLIAKSLTKRSGPKAPSAFYGPLGPIFYPIDKANIIADSLENQFIAHDLRDCDHRLHVEAQVQPFVHYGKTIGKADFKNNPKSRRGKKLAKFKSVWLPSRS